MVFSRKKEKLWRYASENMQFAANADGTNNQPPQPHRLQPQRLPQYHQEQQLIQQSRQSYRNCCLNSNSSPLAIVSNISQHRQQQSNTPLPPYSSGPYGMDCSGSSEVHADYLMSFRQQSQYTTDAETEISASATESEDQIAANYKITGCEYENYGDNMSVDICEQSDNSSYYQLSQKLQEQEQQQQLQQQQLLQQQQQQQQQQLQQVRRPTLTSQTSAVITSTVTTIATTASNLVRNCCGGVFSSQSRIDITCPNNNNASNNNMKNRYEQRHRMGTLTKKSALTSTTMAKEYFNALLKNMKKSQISALLTAVTSRRSDQSILTSDARNRLAVHQQCILVKRGLIIDEEPFVVVCALFLWQNLRDASELKRLPICPTECDPVYVCCNPLHWFRITETTG
ncbi:GATA zinc finger domain-containing protein 10-like [Teleopsis dalmanni]|uniref:GATA zinc finger domain-containing protein 10-like n=1 Tax=Teleopsis dalmanni TaxID=139649 RepID=UPI0018CCFF80|nr:GATA zinc finger domain-containing protein 10-like [Teleopsis dalmanni]